MSTAALTNLRDYLTGTLSPANMLWLSSQLAEYAKKKEEEYSLRPYTMEELNARIDQAEAEIAAGLGTPHEEVMREMDEEIERWEQEELQLETAEGL